MRILLLFYSLSVFSLIYSMEQKDQKAFPSKMYMVFSHGYGGSGDNHPEFDFLEGAWSGPTYSDEGKLEKSVFYTKPSVHMLMNHLHEVANKPDCKGILLVGHSCGAATAINALAKMVGYKNDPNYFQGTKINLQSDVDKIMTAINNGAFIAREPLLSLSKVNRIAIPCSKIAQVTQVGATAVGCYSIAKAEYKAAKMGILALLSLIHYAYVTGLLKKLYAQAVVRWIVPYKTHYKFDPNHEDPLQLVAILEGKLTCPMLLQFNKNDIRLEDPDEDTIKVCETLQNNKTHILITDDAIHGYQSLQFQEALAQFNKKYFAKENVSKLTKEFAMDELKKHVYRWPL